MVGHAFRRGRHSSKISMSVDRIALFFVVTASPAHAWVANAQLWPESASGLWRPEEVQARLGALSGLWDHHPRNGLSSGTISYVMDRRLCDVLLPRFNEDALFVSFFTCDELRASVRRAAASWGVSHPLLQFVDISRDCSREDPVRCGQPDVWITTGDNITSDHDGVVSIRRSYNLSRSFTLSNGRDVSIPTYAASFTSISFDAEACWYLDATFCSYFHALKDRIGTRSALYLCRAILFLIWIITLVNTLLRVAAIVRRWLELMRLQVVGLADVDGDGRLEARELSSLLSYLSCCCRRQPANLGVARTPDTATRSARFLTSEECSSEWDAQLEIASRFSVCCMAVRLAALIGPMLLYARFVSPCWHCFDFEAATVHLFGSVLGLGQPDEAAAMGRNMGTNGTTPYFCLDPWAGVTVRQTPTAPSVMHPVALRPTPRCPQADDVDALNIMYPICGSGRVTASTCFQTRAYVGWLKVLILCGFPVIALLVSLLLLHRCTVHTHLAYRQKLREMYRELSTDTEARLLEHRRAVALSESRTYFHSVRPLLKRWNRGPGCDVAEVTIAGAATPCAGQATFTSASASEHAAAFSPVLRETMCGHAASPARARITAPDACSPPAAATNSHYAIGLALHPVEASPWQAPPSIKYATERTPLPHALQMYEWPRRATCTTPGPPMPPPDLS